MCIGKGMIVTRTHDKPLYLMDSNDHEPIIKKFHLRDKKLIGRDFVRIEMLPCGSLTSMKREDWEVRIDETDTLPPSGRSNRYGFTRINNL